MAVGGIFSVTFDEAIAPATVGGNSVQLLSGSSPVASSVTYDVNSRTATITPSGPLSYSSPYTVSVRGGATDPRIKDLAGNALASTVTWLFTTQAVPPPPPPPLPVPTEGPGGPILVVSVGSNPFSRYPVEILRAEGFNSFAARDIAQVNNTLLAAHDVVVLGHVPTLSAAQVTMFTEWVTAGGTLIVLRPNAQLAPLLGITPTSGTLADKYLRVNTTSSPGVGIVGETMQFHSTADLYTLTSGSDAVSLATLYSSATTATSNPAVTQRVVGTNGGKAIAFTYDLARSVVYTRQGNPAWAGQKRDGASGPIRSDNIFFPDWVDLDKVTIPQADEQQRLLANIMVQGSKKPLPRFWYLPKVLKAAVVMTGDDHGTGGTKNRFDGYLTSSTSNTQQAVDDWTAIRGTSYIYPNTPITPAQVAAYEAQGFEIALHLNTNCAAWTPTSLNQFLVDQLSGLKSSFPNLAAPTTNRTHCISWSDWVSQAKVQLAHGIRLDANYYYWPGSWIQDRPGLFTGSGMPMRFADVDGTLIDVYQATTQLTDESEITYSNHINTLLDNALGPKGYYGVFTANMHTDFLQTSIDGSNTIVAAAKQRNVPVISAKQMLTWLDGRNNSSFSAMTWSGNKLNFSVTLWNDVRNLQGMLPVAATAGRLANITVNGSPVTLQKQTIKGIEYAFFPASAGTYVASYDGVAECTTPTATIAAENPSICPGSPVALKLASATGQAPYTLVVNGQTYSNVSVGQTFATFTPNEASIWGNTGSPANPSATDNQPIEIGTKFRATTNGVITGIRFFKGAGNTGSHVGSLWTATGTKLASATFVNETASGWQEVRFSAPVAISAGTTYIASYFSLGGGFAYSPDFFTTTGVTNGPLTALQSNAANGPNGLFKYGGGFPDGGTTANYWVDVLFKEDAATGPLSYTLTSITDNAGCTATGPSLSAVEVTMSPAPVGTLAAAGPVQSGQDINLVFTATTGTNPFTLLINGTSYPGVTSGTAFNTGVKATASANNSIWSNTTVPAIPAFTEDNAAIEVGVKFRSSVAGQIKGIRFYKGATNTGTHIGSLWNAAGTKLASATFINETASGWQEVLFAEPVTIAANTTYIASYHAPGGNYAYNGSFFSTAPVTNGPLKALQTGEDGGNGVYRYGTAANFPNDVSNGGNFWVDVVFATDGGNTFSLTSITDSKGCINQGALQVLTVQPTAGNTPPVLAAIGNKTATVGVALTFTATATDDTGPLTYSLTGTVPTGATINGTSGLFSWTPTVEQVKEHSFKVVVSDGAASDEETITVTVTNPAPTDILLSKATVEENQPSGTIVGSLSTGAPGTFTYTLVAGTGATDNALFQVVGTDLKTNSVFNFEAKSSYSVRVRATETGTPTNSIEKAFAITVTNVNEAPVLTAIGPKTVVALSALSFTAAATDPDQGQTLLFSLAGTTTPAGTVPTGATISPAGVFSWTPTAAQVGSHTFRVVVSDGTATDDEVITVTVNPAVPACPTLVFTPAAGTALAAGTVGIAYSQTVSTSVTGYTFSATGLPAGLTMNATSGAIGGSPTAAVSNAAITVTATKGECTASANYTLTISPASTPPAGGVAVYRINAGGPAVGLFAADQYFVPGPGDKYTSPNPISGTSTPAIYQSERWGNKQLGYAFPVTNGQYTVVLHFTEIAFSAPGQRVFDVSLENQKVLTAYDIFQRVGANTATSESFLVSVSDGTLNLNLSSLNPGNIENPKISAIEVISASGPSTASVASTAVKVNEKMYEKSIALPVLEAYPNPFSARTTVHFRAAEAGKAQLLVYNALGQLVKTLYDDAVEAGQRYERVLVGTELPEGVYTCRLLLNGKWYTQRLILSK